MRKAINFFFLFIFILFALAFFGALLSTIVSPKIAWPLAFFGLGYAFLFVGLVFFLLYWLFKKDKKMLYPILLLFIAFIALPNAFNFKLRKQKSTITDNALKVMSYNVRNFEVYDSENGKANRDKIVALIENEKPDILCLQEAHTRPDYMRFEDFSKRIGLPYYYFEVGVHAPGGEFGVATFSKFPIKSTKSYPFGSGGNVGLKMDVDIDDTTVSIFNIHLESANIEDSYYNYSDQELEKISKKSLEGRTRRVAGQLKRAYINRAGQAEQIRKEIKKTDNPVLVCGDFNDPAVSYSYTKVKGGLQDTFREGKIGFGSTFPKIPILRIDHIFASRDFEVLDYRIRKDKYSDHYPVITNVRLKE